ncbi:hypothetical protein ATCC90586_005595 [Pythium insidiosum]|nr:hypothetical protein ATCC90586_005595 [Pythium insidiosum]
MGAYLSVVNDTPDTWQCKVGPDEQALKIFTVVITAILAAIGAAASNSAGSSLGATTGTAGALAAALTSSGMIQVMGVGFDQLKKVTNASEPIDKAVSIIGPVSKFALSMANGITNELQKKSYVTIEAGKKHRFGPMTLSLWQQSACMRSIVVDTKTVQTETVYMRPIFSGSTANSNRDHSIQWWINKDGTERSTVEAKEGARRALEEDDVVERLLIFPNGTIIDENSYKVVDVETLN